MKNVLLLGLMCVLGFFIYRDWFGTVKQDGKPQRTPAIAQPTAQASPHSITATKPPNTQGLSPDERKAQLLGAEFAIRAAVDSLAKQWEQRRYASTHNEQSMQRTGEKEFAVLVRRIQDAGLYAERALENVVRAALKHERPKASQAQRETLLDGIFRTMRVNEPDA